MRCRFLNPSSFQKLYRLATPFFHSPGISSKDLTKLLLSEYACRTTGIVLLRRTPVAVGASIQDRGSMTGLRHRLHLAILTEDMFATLYPLQLPRRSLGQTLQTKEAGLNNRPPSLC